MLKKAFSGIAVSIFTLVHSAPPQIDAATLQLLKQIDQENGLVPEQAKEVIRNLPEQAKKNFTTFFLRGKGKQNAPLNKDQESILKVLAEHSIYPTVIEELGNDPLFIYELTARPGAPQLALPLALPVQQVVVPQKSLAPAPLLQLPPAAAKTSLEFALLPSPAPKETQEPDTSPEQLAVYQPDEMVETGPALSLLKPTAVRAKNNSPTLNSQAQAVISPAAYKETLLQIIDSDIDQLKDEAQKAGAATVARIAPLLEAIQENKKVIETLGYSQKKGSKELEENEKIANRKAKIKHFVTEAKSIIHNKSTAAPLRVAAEENEKDDEDLSNVESKKLSAQEFKALLDDRDQSIFLAKHKNLIHGATFAGAFGAVGVTTLSAVAAQKAFGSTLTATRGRWWRTRAVKTRVLHRARTRRSQAGLERRFI